MRRPKQIGVIATAVLLLAGCDWQRDNPKDPQGPNFTKPDAGTDLELDQSTPDLPGPDQAGPDASTDSPLPDLPAGCSQGAYKCIAKESHVCLGNTYTLDTVCPMGCNHATGRCFTFDHSNNVGSLMGQSKYAWTIKGGITINTSTGKMVPPQPGVAIHDKTKWWVISVGKMVIEKNVTLKVLGSRPLIIVAWDFIQIKGTLDLSANGTTSGPGGGAGGATASDGAGCGGGPKGTNPGSMDPWGGGAGGSFGGKGGSGNKSGKATCGDSCLSPLVGGSGGGGGRNINGEGGAGGGSLQLTAGSTIVVDGVIHAGGGGGRGGKYGDTGAGGGGGGSGGGVLLEALQVTINGTVAANGGGGGGSATLKTSGGAGKDGDTTITPAAGGNAGTAWFAGAGGAGGAYATINGGNGGSGVASIGGGGGGAGRICIRTGSGKVSGKPTLSPNHPSAVSYKKVTLK